MADLHFDIGLPGELKMAEFKSDQEKMSDVNVFLDDLFHKAVKEAEKRKSSSSDQKSKHEILGIQSKYHINEPFSFLGEVNLDFFSVDGTKKIGVWSSRARTSARSFASRVFTTICNCTNSVRNVVVNKS